VGAICTQQPSHEARTPGLVLQPVQRSPEVSGELGQDAERHYLRALQLNAAGDDARAEKEFREAVNKTPNEDKYVRSLALFHIARSRYDEAIGVIGDYVKLCGVTALGYELEAELLFQKRLYDPALEAALASLKLYNSSARMHQLLALIHIAKRKDGAAAVELRKAVELDPNHAGIRYLLGRVLYSTGGYAEARDQFLACLKIQPSYRKVLENLGLCYEALQDYPKATQAYHDAITLEESQKGPKHAEPYAFYGAMLAKVGESEKALAVLRQGVAVSPRSFVANYHLGRLLLNLGDNAEAEKFLLTAADLDPKFSRTYYLLGNLRQKQSRRAEAERYRALFKDLDKVPENRVFPLTDR
jgi:tetratricopeptide (TPR) repeat protein